MANKLWNVEPAEDLQKMAADKNKTISDKWNQTNNASSLVTEADRKTGKVSDSSTASIQAHGYTPNQ